MAGPLANSRYELFAQEKAKGASDSKAYEAAGFKPNPKNAGRLKKIKDVQDRIDELLSISAKAVGITLENVLAELGRIGFANISDYVDTSGPAPEINLKGVSREKLAALSEITTESVFENRGTGKPVEVRKVKIKLWDKRGALVDLGKHLGMGREVTNDEDSGTFKIVIVNDPDIKT